MAEAVAAEENAKLEQLKEETKRAKLEAEQEQQRLAKLKQQTLQKEKEIAAIQASPKQPKKSPRKLKQELKEIVPVKVEQLDTESQQQQAQSVVDAIPSIQHSIEAKS